MNNRMKISVNERLQEAREQIPEGFGDPRMGPISTGMGLVLFYYLEDTTGEYSLTELRTMQDWIVKFHLQTVPGVTEVLGIGGWEKQFHVVLDPNALLRYDVTVNEIMERIRANNLNVGAQFIEKNAEQFIVRSVGLASTIQDLEDIVIKAEDGRPIFFEPARRSQNRRRDSARRADPQRHRRSRSGHGGQTVRHQFVDRNREGGGKVERN